MTKFNSDEHQWVTDTCTHAHEQNKEKSDPCNLSLLIANNKNAISSPIPTGC